MIWLPHPDPFETLYEEVFTTVSREQFEILLYLACTDEEEEHLLRAKLALSPQELGECLDDLLAAELIEVYHNGRQNVYYMTQEQCDDLMEFLYTSLTERRNETSLNLKSNT